MSWFDWKTNISISQWQLWFYVFFFYIFFLYFFYFSFCMKSKERTGLWFRMNHWLFFNCFFFCCCWFSSVLRKHKSINWAQVDSAVSISNYHFIRKPRSALNFNWIVIIDRLMNLKVCFRIAHICIEIAKNILISLQCWKLYSVHTQICNIAFDSHR